MSRLSNGLINRCNYRTRHIEAGSGIYILNNIHCIAVEQYKDGTTLLTDAKLDIEVEGEDIEDALCRYGIEFQCKMREFDENIIDITMKFFPMATCDSKDNKCLSCGHEKKAPLSDCPKCKCEIEAFFSFDQFVKETIGLDGD